MTSDCTSDLDDLRLSTNLLMLLPMPLLALLAAISNNPAPSTPLDVPCLTASLTDEYLTIYQTLARFRTLPLIPFDSLFPESPIRLKFAASFSA